MKEILKFFKFTIIAIILLVIADYGIGVVVESYYKNSPVTKVHDSHNYYDMNRAVADVIILGSSRALCHFDSEILSDSLNLSVFNGGLSSSHELGYWSVILKRIINRKVPKIVLLECADRFLTNDLNSIDKQYLMSFYYDEDYCKNRINQFGDEYTSLRMCLNSYRLHEPFLNLFRNLWNKPLNNGYYPLSVTENKGKLIRGGKERVVISDVMIKRVEEFAKICKANGIYLCLFDSPTMNTLYNQNLQSKYLCQKLGLDYIDDCYIPQVIQASDFHDNQHLSFVGAEKFTSFFASQLKQKISNYNNNESN